MGANMGQLLKTPDIAKNQFCSLDFYWSGSSGTYTLTPVSNSSRIVWGTTAAAPLTTAAIDSFTGNTNDILGDTCFASTAMGTDSFGFVIDMNGQAAEAVCVEAFLYDSTVIGVGKVASTSALTNSLSTALACSTLGNLYGRVVMSGLDASSSLLHIRVTCRLK